MDKELQRCINSWCDENYQKAIQEMLKTTDYNDCKRLRTCDAWVYETDNYYLLRSFKTIVAVIRKDNKQGYDVLRGVYGFTRRSAGQIAKFFSDYGDRRLVYTYR